MILALFSLVTNAYLLNQVVAVNRNWPVYEYHDLQIVRIVDDHRWLLAKNDGTIFRADFCFDYDIGGLNPKVGEVIEQIRYEDRGCWSVAKPDMKVIFKKNPNNGEIIGDN